MIIARGRDYDGYEALEAYMDKLFTNIHNDIQIVCGLARGADTLGEQYAKKRAVILLASRQTGTSMVNQPGTKEMFKWQKTLTRL